MTKLIFINFRWALPFSFALAALSFPVMARVWFDYLMGGHGWRQGDWLINLGSGFVRRGTMGEAFIMVSDFTGVQLLVVVQVFQTVLFIALVFVTWLIGLLHSNHRLLLFLAASPAFFLIFWAGDLQGTMRKELFGFLALGLLALGSVMAGRAPFYPILAVVLFTLGSIGNVIHVLMAPAIIAGFYLSLVGGDISWRLFKILASVALAMGVLWMGLALWFREVPELAGLCDPLVARGFSESFCSDALRWLVAGEVDYRAEILQKMVPDALAQYFVVTVLSLVPVFLSFFVFAERRMLTILLLITFVPMLPLYAIATDWGRWLSIPFTSYVFLLVQAHAVGKLTIVNMPSMRLVYLLIAVALLISPEHTIGWQLGGAVRSFTSTVSNFF